MPGLLDPARSHEPVQALLADELGQVRAIFAKQLASMFPAVNRLCRHVERYRGKMLRPTVTLLSGLAASGREPSDGRMEKEASGGPRLRESHRILAAVFEMIHMATLVHDDVLDDAQMRRQGATLNYLRGNEAAVLLGDYLISNSFHLCSTLGRPEINRRVGEVTNHLCMGELLQLDRREDWSIDAVTYYRIIESKTASLVSLCCELGAAESGAPTEVVEALANYGRLLGVAFQIQDDVLDLVGEQQVVGKSLGKDLEKGKLTLPVILFLEEAEAAERSRMLRLLGKSVEPDRMERIRALVRVSGAAERARQSALSLVCQAKTQLARIPESPAQHLLEDMADSTVCRQF